MKKIITGLFFRLIKGFEIWALIALLITASFAINLQQAYDQVFLYFYRSEDKMTVSTSDGDFVVDADNVRQYCFENSGMSAYDYYRKSIEPVPEISDNGQNIFFGYDEMMFLASSVSIQIVVPSILIVIFMPVCFGRVYSDGTMKNYLACGISKGTIYLSSLVFSFALDLFMVLINILVFAGFCLYYAWKPPLYLPVILAILASSVLFLFTITSICLSVLFVSAKRTATFIVGFLLEFLLVFNSFMTLIPLNKIIDSQPSCPIDGKEFAEYKEIVKKNSEEGLYTTAFYEKLDLSEFSIKLFHEGKEIKVQGDSTLPPALKYTLLTAVYINPAMIHQLISPANMDIQIPIYMICRDGLAAVNIACNIIWITLSSGIGVSVFRKREVAS